MSRSQHAPMPLVPMSTSPVGISDFYVHAPESNAARNGEKTCDDCATPDIKRAGYFKIKTGVDRLVTALLCMVALPVVLVVALAILLLDGRPVFYRQVRLGKNGREFWIWKFRTMRRHAERDTGAVWSCVSDPRITRLGRWLRCSHLDELPQFFNILAGDMNLVGPRPERPEFAHELARELPNYMERTAVRPGITGLAQLRLGYDHSIADVQKKVRLDLQYIRSASFSQDAWLLACTLPYVAGQLIHKWNAGRRSPQASSKPDETELSQTLVPPPVRRDETDRRSMPAPHFPRSLPGSGDACATHRISSSVSPILASMDRVEGECA